MTRRARLIQIITIVVFQAITLILLQLFLPGLDVDSLGSALVVAAILILAGSLYWWVFVTLFSWLPIWLFPVLTFVLSGLAVLLAGSFVPGITIKNLGTGIWIALALTAVNAILGGLLSLDLDDKFDRNVTRRLVTRRGKPIKSDVPGFLFLEIDGLGRANLLRALDDGQMPNLARWIAKGTHEIIGWETEFSSQTGAMQSGILLGNNVDIPAYRWWDRQQGRLVMSGLPKDAQAIEARLSNGRGLCSDGGASRGNMFSGDATESMFTFSSILNRERGRGPGFYFYLVSPYVVARLIARFVNEIIKEWWQASQQRRRKDPYRVSARNLAYGFLRGFMGPVLQDLITYTVISDVLRGVPAIYALYAGYDDLAHFAGMTSPEVFESLHEIDRYLGRIERALAHAPRPYHIVVLSDHGQSLGRTFQATYGLSLEELVKGLVKGDAEIFYSMAHNEAWDDLSAFLTEATTSEERTASVVRRMLASRQRAGYVEVGPGAAMPDKMGASAEEAQIVVLASGCTGLVYFTDSSERRTYEQIQDAHPELIVGLINHPGIGFVMVKSQEQGDMVISNDGVHYLEDDHVDGTDPLAVFGPNAAAHMRRESRFSTCPDIVVNTAYDPRTEELAGFENQASHHGGLGGPQNHPFVLRPTVLSYDGAPLVGATSVYKLLRGWRDTVQGMPEEPEGI